MSSVSGDLPTAILEGPPGPPGEKGIFQDLGHWVYIYYYLKRSVLPGHKFISIHHSMSSSNKKYCIGMAGALLIIVHKK